MRLNLPVTGRELTLPADINLLSTTALDGSITYANAAFIDVCGYTEAELIGQPHNLIPHPDMPSAAFADLWQSLQAGRSWMGLVKNRCKNGDHYWVNAYVTPILHNGRPVEYQSVRTAASAEQVRAGEALYAVLRRGEPLRLSGLPISLQLSLANLAIAVAASPLAYLFGGAAAAGLLTGVGVLHALPLFWLLRPLQRLATRAEAIACNPLASYLYSGRRDALGRIDFALFSREAELRAVMGRVADSAHQMDPMLANLKAAVDSSRQATQRQHRETERVAVAIEEMVNSMQAVSGSTRDSAQSVSAVERETRSGLDQAGHTRTAMVRLADQVGQASQVIDQLQNHSHEINKALEMIEEVAEQTNLLALNAAIEAARAGEAGRGFAVVADEVRALARRTQGSTQDIQSIIRALQQKAGAAVQVMQASRDQTGDGLAQVSRVTTDLQAVRGQVSQLHAMSQQIAAATQAQGQACDDVQGSIEQIRLACEHNVGISEHSQQCAAAVAGQALRLLGLVEQFALRTR